MKRKAQLQLMENAFILLIIFIILVIAFVFVMVMQNASQQKKIEEFKELELIKKSQILNFLPEMQCSDNNNLDPDCYDILKIETFTEYLETEKLYYHSLLGFVKIEVVMYDISNSPGNMEVTTYTIYDNKKPDYQGVRQVQFPVLLKDVIENNNHFGVIYLGVYE